MFTIFIRSLSIVLALSFVPIQSQATGCLWENELVGSVTPDTAPAPARLPSNKRYALYYFFQHWCPSCEGQAGEIEGFRNRHEGDVQLYAVPFSGSQGEVEEFLSANDLSAVPVLWEGADVFGSMETHPVMIFRDGNGRYFRVTGYTELAELEQIFSEFKGR